MTRPANYRHKLFLLSALVLLTLPLFTHAAVFQNPLGRIRDVRMLIGNLIWWVISLSVSLALLALVSGGAMLVTGGFGNEQQAAQAKKIITWAIIGLLVVGTATVFLRTIRFILFG